MPRHGDCLPLRTRLERNMVPEPNSGCWLWTAAVDRSGYGFIQDTYPERKLRKAHRASYEEYVGPIPHGMQVCHRCDVPCCINPAHLFVGTNADNQIDCVRKGRNPNQKLTVELVRELRASFERGEITQGQIGQRHGLSSGQVSLMLRRLKWRHADKR